MVKLGGACRANGEERKEYVIGREAGRKETTRKIKT
jgi:hypothetical protein